MTICAGQAPPDDPTPAVSSTGAPLPAATPAARLPRADALTDALLGAGEEGARLTDAGILSVVERLEQGLDDAVAGACREEGAPLHGAAPARLIRIGHYQVARALDSPAGGPVPARHADSTGGFRWTARTARRAIGLAALRAGLDGRAAAPAEAVGLVLSEPGGPYGVGRAGPGSCADWITALAPPARALVASEASGWVTRLWTGLDWSRLPPEDLVVGGPDRWWRWRGTWPAPSGHRERGSAGPGPSTFELALRGRADVRIVPSGCRGAPGGAHLVVLDGCPGPGTRHALLLSALVAVLPTRRPTRPATAPGRVVGWWPECGRAWIVRVDARTLALASEAVVAAASAMVRSGAPGGSPFGR